MFEQRGEKSQRVMVLEVLSAVPYGETVPYERLSGVMGGADVQTVQA